MKLLFIYFIIISNVLLTVKTDGQTESCDEGEECTTTEANSSEITSAEDIIPEVTSAEDTISGVTSAEDAIPEVTNAEDSNLEVTSDDVTNPGVGSTDYSSVSVYSSTVPSVDQKNTTQMSLLRRLLSKFKIYYGDNDRPVTEKLASIKGYLKRFGYIDYVKRLFMTAIKERVGAHQKRKKQRYKYRITFGQLLREDITSMADVVKTALKMFQKFMRLEVTGLPNTLTLLQMNKPRCGGKDMGEQRVEPNYMTVREKLKKVIGNALKSLRSKRHTLAGSRWTIKNITYKITKYPAVFKDKRHIIDEQIAKAFKYWSDITPLRFIRMPSITPARDVIIDIRWERGEHGDGDPLDGAGKVLAHSYFPQYGGDAHFDEDEIWTIDSSEGSNVLVTAIHEIGHSLGLDHSDVTNSIMNPVYQPYKKGQLVILHQDDIRAIQILYGAKSGEPEIPNLCLNASVDGLLKELNSSGIFVFKGKYYWKIRSEEMTIDSMYPKLISELFPGIDTNINAVIQVWDSSRVAFIVFKGEMCYKYSDDSKLKEGFPQKIKDLYPNLPTNMESAIRVDETIYAFKGASYWKYTIDSKDEQSAEPMPIESKWPGVPSQINAVLSIKNAIYFFKDQGFYRLNKFDNKYQPTTGEPPYPRKTSLWWFGCQS